MPWPKPGLFLRLKLNKGISPFPANTIRVITTKRGILCNTTYTAMTHFLLGPLPAAIR